MKLIQFAIVLFFVGADGAWHWTAVPPGSSGNTLLAAVVGVIAALAFTVAVIKLRELLGLALKRFNQH